MRCSYCHDGLPALWVCPGCRTVLHADCQRESHVCPSLGCEGGDAPEPEAPTHSRLRSFVLGFLWVGAVASLMFAGTQLYEHVNPKPIAVVPASLGSAPTGCDTCTHFLSSSPSELELGSPADPQVAKATQAHLRDLVAWARDHADCRRPDCRARATIDIEINKIANAWARADRIAFDRPYELLLPRPSAEELGKAAEAALRRASASASGSRIDHAQANAIARAFFLRLAEWTRCSHDDDRPIEFMRLGRSSFRPACGPPSPPPACDECEQVREVVEAARSAYAPG